MQSPGVTIYGGGHSIDKYGFPNNLKLSATPTALIPIINAADHTYKVNLVGLLLRSGLKTSQLRTKDNIGRTSPLSKVTLGAAARHLANVPLEATRFCWAYPLHPRLHELLDQSKVAADWSPDLALILYGGFLYTDENGKCLQANAIGIGTGLLFGVPEPWRADLTKGLHEAKRIQPVTIPEFREKGARHFCWVHPGETLEARNQGEPMVIQHGAFIFLFSANPLEKNPQNIFFSIKPGTGKNFDVWYAQLDAWEL